MKLNLIVHPSRPKKQAQDQIPEEMQATDLSKQLEIRNGLKLGVFKMTRKRKKELEKQAREERKEKKKK